MIKRKKSKRDVGQDVVATNRWGCGCITFILFGVIVAMIVAGLFQSP